MATDRLPPQVIVAGVEAEEPVPAAVRRAELAWRRLGLRIRSITPSGLARFLLAASAVAVGGWVLASAWLDLLPFQLGFVLAYITLPIVNRLDRFMPRALAATTVVLVEFLSVLLFLGVVVPPVVGDVTRLAASLASSFDPRLAAEQLRERVDALPAPARTVVLDLTQQAAATIQTNLGVYVQQAANLAVAGALQAFATLGFILGFIAIPTWLVAVLTGNRAAGRALQRTIPEPLRADVWAVGQILDRTLGTYLRGQVLAAVAVGLATFVGLVTLQKLIWPELQYAVLLAVLAGVLNLIPLLGPIIAAIPAVFVGTLVAPEAGAAILGLYILVQWLEATFVQPLIERRTVDIHPAVLVVVLVALSQFGFVWVLLGAPIAVVARDLFRYTYGRLGDPPRPAGVLPDSRRFVGVQLHQVGVEIGGAPRMLRARATGLPPDIAALSVMRANRRAPTSPPTSQPLEAT